MTQQPNNSQQNAQQNAQDSSQDWPRDFNLRAQAAEQQEVVQQAHTWFPTPQLTCSDYDFN